VSMHRELLLANYNSPLEASMLLLSSLAFIRSTFFFCFSCFARSFSAILLRLSALVNTRPHDFGRYVVCLLTGEGHLRNLLTAEDCGA
jgi:hypothetical protein